MDWQHFRARPCTQAWRSARQFSVYPPLFLPPSVYPPLSAPFCLPHSACTPRSTEVCLLPSVYTPMSTPLCLPPFVYSPLSTRFCLPPAILFRMLSKCHQLTVAASAAIVHGCVQRGDIQISVAMLQGSGTSRRCTVALVHMHFASLVKAIVYGGRHAFRMGSGCAC